MDLPCLDSHEVQAIGDQLYIMGGFETGSLYACYSELIKLDPVKAQFVVVRVSGAKPEARMNFASCKDNQNRIIIFGGAGDVMKYNDLKRFDPATDEWQTICPKVDVAALEGH